MNLQEYLKSMVKDNCPPNCRLSREGVEIARVPPPNEILGIIISRDPPISWWHFYRFAMAENQEDTARKMLYASAIPGLLMDRIWAFMGERINWSDLESLYNIVFKKVYWTHLHKCFTDKSQEKTVFKPRDATICANQWLKEELLLVITEGAQFILTLGREAQNWIEKWQKEAKESEKVKVIKLPHPSGLNRKWNNKNDKNILTQVRLLIDICRLKS